MAHESDPNRIGATIGVESSADLAELDATGLTLGTIAYVTALASDFTLTLSTASLVDGHVVAVKGIDGYRWILGGGGGGGGAWLNPLTQYVSPTGSDANTGLGWDTAKQYLGTAYEAVFAAGGGEIHFANGTKVHPDGRGLRLRDDGLPVPGWYQICPVRIIGHGSAQTQFGYRPVGGLIGGATFTQGRFNPCLWMCASGTDAVAFQDIGFGADPDNPNVLEAAATSVRLGWDYQRGPGPDYAPKFQTITSWARTTPGGGPPGTAVVTVTAPTYPIVSMSRLSNVVTVNFTNTDPVLRWASGMPFSVAGTPGSFPAGTFTVNLALGIGSIQYVQAGADVPLAAATGTLTSTGVNVHDRIEVVSTSAEVASTQYKVLAVTPTTWTVTDWYGQSPRTPTITVSNPGKAVLQDRSFTQSVGLTSFYGCQGAQLYTGTDAFESGPTVDLGATPDGRLLFYECVFFGGKQLPGFGPIDPDRQAWLLADAGGTGAGFGFFVKHSRPNAGGIRCWGDGWGADLDDIQADIAVPLIPPPIIESCSPEPAPTSKIICTRSGNTDKGTPTDPDVVCTNMLANNVFCTDAEVVVGPATVLDGESAFGWAFNRVSSPLSQGQVGFWADRRIAGRYPGNYRSTGLVQTARYQNLIVQDSSGWTHTGTTVTTGIADPFGGTSAIHFAGTGSSSEVVEVTTSDTSTRASGDRWAYGCWVRADGGLVGGSTVDGVVTLAYNQNIYNGPFQFQANTPFLGDGEWQWLVCSGTIATLDNPLAFSHVLLEYVGNLSVYRPTLVKVPAGEMTDNEFAEYVITLRNQPEYLLPNMSGTDTGTKFVAHSGLGTAARYVVGGASGQITLSGENGKAVELFDESGNSLGVAVLQDFTVNP